MKLSAGVAVRVPNLAYRAGQTLGLSRKNTPDSRSREPGTDRTASEFPAKGAGNPWQSCQSPGGRCHAGAEQAVRFLLFGWLAVSTAGAAGPSSGERRGGKEGRVWWGAA